MADLINALDLNLLKVFRALYDERSTTRAATRLSVSQSAVSRALQKLRASFRDPLFEWHSNSMVPIPAAHLLAKDIEAALDGVEHALKTTREFEPATSEATITIGLTDYAIYAIFPNLFRHVREHAPHMSIALRPVSQDEAGGALHRREVDIAIVSERPGDDDLVVDFLFEEDYVVIGDRSVIEVPPGVMAIKDYLRYEHALCSFSGGRRGWVDGVLEERGVSRKVQFLFHSFSPMIANLKGTNLLATVPRRLGPYARDRFDLSVWELPFPSHKHSFQLVRRRGRSPDPALEWFQATLVSTIQ